ncbi:DUF4399 domain-containing protein [Gammaproteobacteria bacterium]|nr:DUF4399 domain-containing protein [Gammaproteobacteria bacterium]
MLKIKKIIYFIFLLSITSLSYGGNNEEKSIKLEGVENGKTYSSPIKLNFIVKNMRVLKAGVNEKNSGHHHLLINLKDLPDLKLSLPMTKNIIHFGKGQTSTNLELKPGKHTIQLLFADYSHTPHEKPLITDKITFFIK